MTEDRYAHTSDPEYRRAVTNAIQQASAAASHTAIDTYAEEKIDRAIAWLETARLRFYELHPERSAGESRV